MEIADLLVEQYKRINEEVDHVLTGLDDEALGARIDPDANSIAWLIWHLTRVLDHLVEKFDVEQVWIAQGWYQRFGLPFPVNDDGYGHTADQVGALSSVPAELLRGYHEATWQEARTHLSTLTPKDLDRIVDTRWTPAVTLGVRLASVLSDDLQHVGQAAYVRGILERR